MNKFRPIVRELLAIAVMFAAVISVYWNPIKPGNYPLAMDYEQLHRLRMRYARNALSGPDHILPGWYSRELLGTPFWSNVQSFPFIPTRLAILPLDPEGPYTYTIATTLAALLSSLFMYLFCRRIGTGLIGSAVAGFTFAACGYFSSRVGAGHLPLLEVFCGLPLLLWTIEGFVSTTTQRGRLSRRWIAALAISTCCLSLGGHPQLPIYAMFVAAVYALWRGGIRLSIWIWASMGIGIACAAFSLLPMTLLVGRSTRILPLATPSNDLAMPYERLLGFFAPWHDGAAPPMPLAVTDLFHGYLHYGYFWDTIVFTGWWPWAAVVALAASLLSKTIRQRIDRRILFVCIVGVAGIVLSLPIIHDLLLLVRGTILRSTARWLYLSEFGLAAAAGGAISLLIARARQSRLPLRVAIYIAVPALIAAHFFQLYSFDSAFMFQRVKNLQTESDMVLSLLPMVRDQRVAVDMELPLQSQRMGDDIGFFDSIMLARPYRFLMALSRVSDATNVQNLNGSQLPQRTLEAAGVKFIFTLDDRPDLEFRGQVGPVRVYATQAPMRRAGFYDIDQTNFLPPDQIHELLKQPQLDLRSTLLLPSSAKPEVIPSAPPAAPDTKPQVAYRRPDSDRIECTVTTERPGYLRVIESWDPGWSATVDGSPAPVVPAYDALLCVAVAPGTHEVKFEFNTPGENAGIAVSLLGVLLLTGYLLSAKHIPIQRKPRPLELPATTAI